METITSIRPVLVVLFPTIIALLIIASHKRPNVRESLSVIGGIATWLTALSMVPDIWAGNAIEYTLFKLLPGISVKFMVDGLSLIFATLSSFLWILVTFYNIGYMRGLHEHAQTRYFHCFSMTITGAMGVALSGNVFTLFLFYEVITIFTYPLVAHHQDEEAYYGAKKYLIYLVGTSELFILPAIVLTYLLAGTLDFSITGVVDGIFPPDASPTLVTITYALYILGFAKTAMIPLHTWLPSAMVAPTPVSALLHAVAVVKAGAFSISRVMLSVFGLKLLNDLSLGIATAYFASFTIIVASIIALTKDDLKARLAYSTVSQLSYIILGVAMLTPNSVTGGLIHIANHGFSKITLFLCAGAIFVASRKKKISQLDGIGRRMPWTMIAFAIASLSMIGVPGVAGFVTKWYLVVGSMELKNVILLALLLGSSLLNAAYFAPIVFKAFFREERKLPSTYTVVGEDGHSQKAITIIEGHGEASPFMVIPLVLTAVISVIIGIFPNYFVSLAKAVLP